MECSSVTSRCCSLQFIAELDFAGCIVAEFQTTSLVGTCVPCGSGAGDHKGDGFARLRREEWAVAFYDFMTSLVARARSDKKGIIWTGELANVSYKFLLHPVLLAQAILTRALSRSSVRRRLRAERSMLLIILRLQTRSPTRLDPKRKEKPTSRA